jgi:hypothetical protein
MFKMRPPGKSGLTAGLLGLVFAAFALGYALFEVPWGVVGDRLGLRQVDPAVEEGALGELAGVRRPRPARQQRAQHLVEHDGAAMAVQHLGTTSEGIDVHFSAEAMAAEADLLVGLCGDGTVHGVVMLVEDAPPRLVVDARRVGDGDGVGQHLADENRARRGGNRNCRRSRCSPNQAFDRQLYREWLKLNAQFRTRKGQPAI